MHALSFPLGRRRLGVMGGLLILLIGLLPAAASARDASFDAAFSANTHLGEGGFSTELTFTGTEYHGQVAPLTASSAGAASTLHSVRWLRANCPVVLLVSLFAPSGSPKAETAGTSLQGKKTEVKVDGTAKAAVLYTWHLAPREEYCGIVGGLPGPPRPKYVSLMPTSQTAHGGKYLDESVQSFSGIYIEEFWLYAREVHHR
jgi:hypothetical protein